MRRLHAYVPHLSLGLARARRSEPFPTGPLVLGGKPWDPGPVIDASPDARALGVRRGMPLASAQDGSAHGGAVGAGSAAGELAVRD